MRDVTLGNRRMLEQRLDVALPMSRRSMTPVSALMIDVDHFKAYNDHYGHPAGDDCLLEIANVLRDTFRRETDILVRLGGEEFLVVLLEVGADDALYRCKAAGRNQSLHHMVNAATFGMPDQRYQSLKGATGAPLLIADRQGIEIT